MYGKTYGPPCRSVYKASFLTVSKQIYSQSFEKYWNGAGAGAIYF